MRISKEGPSEPKCDNSSSEPSSSTEDNYSRSVRTKKGRKGIRSKTGQFTKNIHNSFDGGGSGGHRSQSSTTAGGGPVDPDDYEMDSNSGVPSGVPISSISSGIGNDNPTFFTDEVFFSQNDVVEGPPPPPPPPQRKKGGGGRRKKKFPPSPLPLYSSPRKTSLSSRSPSSYNNETDLVDYEDFGPSSSTYDDSSDSESELALRSTTNNQHRSSSLFHGHSSMGESGRGGRTAGTKDSPWSRRASLYENKDEPCSSSSVRERLPNKAPNSYSNNPNSNNSLVELEDPFTSVFVGEMGGTSERGCGESEAATTATTSTTGRSSMKKVPADKYKFSGVGHHFGRKKTLSSINLLEEGGSGGSGGEGGGSESSLNGGFLAGVDVLGWATRLKAFTIILLASTFILSTSSLLFVFPIIVDPILLGLEAHFSNSSVLCRTTNIRKGSGSSECSMQSCREGCTADSFQCTFIDVEYFPSLQLPSSSSSDINITSSFIEQSLASLNTSSLSPTDSDSSSGESRRENGTLFININGCGYPPSVNCSQFHEKYGKIGTPFLCHFSQSNSSIVVPNYNVSQQKRYLFLAFVIPIGLSVGSALSLFFILKVRWACRRGNGKGPSREVDKTPTKLFETAEGLEEKLRGKDSPGESKKTKGKKKKEALEGGKHAKANGISNSSTGQNHLKNHSEMNGTVIGDVKSSGNKANGFALQNTISGLMGMSSPHKIHQSIKTLPHQHDSFEGNNVSILNGFAAFAIDQPETNHYNRSAVKRKPLYAKNNPNRNKLFHANSIDETRRLPSEGLMSHQSSNGIHSINSNPPNGNANNESGHRNKKSKMAEDKL